MLVPTVCLNCGAEIGQLAEVFIHLRKAILKKKIEERGTVPRKAMMDLTMSIDSTELMEKLGVRYECCRTHLSTAQNWTDFH